MILALIALTLAALALEIVMVEPISVLLVDDNPAFLRIATRFLQEHNDIAVIGAADGGEEALALAQDLQPDVVLIDLAMPGLSGLATIPLLRAMLPEVGIIALTVLDIKSYRQAALEAGANGFVPKASLNTDLPPTIRRVAQADPSQPRSADKSV
jgi:DNA-binding NarL/FixJ family response regulator